MPYRLTSQAQREREAALRYQAAEWGPVAAEDLSQAFIDLFDLISSWSPPGSTREQWADPKYRWARVGKYSYFAVWAYGAGSEDRVIVRILHASRDLGALMHGTEDWS
jgi:plasmid stabilization system protein ParE